MKDLDEINTILKLFNMGMIAEKTQPCVRDEAPVGTWHYALFTLYPDPHPFPGRPAELRKSSRPIYRFKNFENMVIQIKRIIKEEQMGLDAP